MKCLRYDSIRHDGVIILTGLTAYKSVFDVTPLQTVSTNELISFQKPKPIWVHSRQNYLNIVHCIAAGTLFSKTVFLQLVI